MTAPFNTATVAAALPVTLPTRLEGWAVTRYGGPEVLGPVTRDITPPGEGQILIRVRASAATRADGMMRAGQPRFARLFLGLGRPRNDLVGTCLAGDVIAVGPGVTRFAPGDAVFGEAGLSFGANATYLTTDADGVLMHKPTGLSYVEAAVLADGPLTSLNFLRNLAGLRPGERVLILGAAGSLGTAAVQIAAAMGADVTGTCSARNAGLVASLGAARVIDYRAEDPLADAGRYDVIYDTLGISGIAASRRALAQGGRYICPILGLALLGAMMRNPLRGARGKRALFAATGMLKPQVLRPMMADLLDMMAADQLAPVMDRTYPLSQIVEAHRYVDGGHKTGNVVLV